ncbi:hypothetical protein [Roseateles sp.]|uniref:hypothetical protein n=1 Tax=Roseateles sp. TaxID=1971397 RepID=UPI0025D5DB8C|nr:hypothetical protein [Roseateles sp.]MBV8035037.1 hypothetical protein [Roseateles sp.]
MGAVFFNVTEYAKRKKRLLLDVQSTNNASFQVQEGLGGNSRPLGERFHRLVASLSQRDQIRDCCDSNFAPHGFILGPAP